MSILGIFPKSESDPELQQLQNMAKASRNVPEPYVELSLAYLAKVETPPDWDADYAKKAVESFRKATAIAAKQDPSQTGPIREHFVEKAYKVAAAYRAYHDAHPDLKALEAASWLLEQLIPELNHVSHYKAKVEDLLGSCALDTAIVHEAALADDETEGEDRLKLYVAAAERAMNYVDRDTRVEMDAAVADMQIAVGLRYAERARQSSVLNRPDGTLLDINDREHKGYAKLAMRLAREGRARLEPYPTSEEFDENMAAANAVIAESYLVLYNLTWAHSKMSKAIKILKEAVKVVPEDADLWNALGRAYELLAEEWVSETQKGYNRGASVSDFMGTYSGCADLLGRGLVSIPLKLQVRNMQKKAAECYQKATLLE